MSNPYITISIVTPSLNQGRYIEETIKSVISQEGDFFIEYFVMDGGSTDHTIEILKHFHELIINGAWEQKCLGIEFRWVSEKDRGQAHAINKGFRKARGEIVSWINSDDLYYKNAFSLVAEHFSKHPKDDFAFGDGDVINELGDVQWEWLSRPYDLKLLKSYHFLWNDFTNYIMQQATFWRKDVFNKIGMLDESFRYAMDVEYWIRAGEAGARWNHIPVKLGKFRMISGTKSLSSPTVFWPDMLEIFRRYNGARKMAFFFSYYFYNIARNNGYDMSKAWEKTSDLFPRWKSLSKQEKEVLEKEMRKGFEKACLISMNQAFIEIGRPNAISLFKSFLQGRPLRIFNSFALSFIVKCIFGQKISRRFYQMQQLFINFYRERRYQYRYLGRNKGFFS
jgi:glycosyltransferase involved in cell wall biosynthesis